MKNTKYLICSFLLLFLMSSSLQAVIIVPNGTTLTIGNQNFTQSFIVEDGGVLVVNGNPVLGHPSPSAGPVEILIKDGGRMTSQGGSISGLSPGKFTGIIVEGTIYAGGNTSNALYLNNFSISDATEAIKILGSTPSPNQSINQRIYVRNTEFFDCVDLLKSSGLSQFNRDNSYNSITFESCTFINYGTGYWPIHMHFMNNLTFSNCTFDMSGDLNLHFNMQRNCSVIGCSFINTAAVVGMVFHRDNYNIKVNNNEFFGGGISSSYVAVGVGVTVHSGIFHSGEIRDNVFNDCGAGVSIGDAAGVSGGQDGDVDDVIIFGNVFNDNGIGIQSSESTNVRIQRNDFNSCRNGVRFNGADNVSPNVLCNQFVSCRAAIRIDDPTLSQFYTFQNGADAHNRFYSCLIDINNNNGGMFIYNLYQWWYSGRASSFVNVSVGLGPLLQKCKRWLIIEEEEEHEEDGVGLDNGSGQRNEILIEGNQAGGFDVQNVYVNPNPSIDGIFKIQVTSNFEESTIQVFSSLGQQVFADQINNNEVTRMDLSNLPKGIYLLNVKTDKLMKTERIVIQ